MKPDNYFKVSVWSDSPVPTLELFEDSEIRAYRKPVRRTRRQGLQAEPIDQRRAYSWTFPFRSRGESVTVDGADYAWLRADCCADVLRALGFEPTLSVFSPEHTGTFNAPVIGMSQEQEQQKAQAN